MGIMINQRAVAVLLAVLDGARTPDSVAKEIGISVSRAYQIISSLRRNGLLKPGRGPTLPSDQPHAQALYALIKGAGLTRALLDLLSENGLRIALSAPVPMDKGQIRRLSQLPKTTFYRWFYRLEAEGWLINVGPNLYACKPLAYTTPREIHDFLVHWHSFLASRWGFTDAVVKWTNGVQAIVLANVGWNKGELTAFSAFYRFGIKVFLKEIREYAVPKRTLKAQDVFDHACLLADDLRKKGFCLKFYIKNKKILAKHKAMDLILAGERIEGWPSPESEEMESMG